MFNQLEMYEDVLIWTFGTKFTFHLPSFFFVQMIEIVAVKWFWDLPQRSSSIKLNSHLFKGSSIASSCHAVPLDTHARPCRNNPHRNCQSVRSSWTSSFVLELQESLSGPWPVDVLTMSAFEPRKGMKGVRFRFHVRVKKKGGTSYSKKYTF